MAKYNSRAEFENEANKKKAKELSSKIESEERARKAKEEIDKKRDAQKIKGDDGLPTDPVGDPADPIGGGDPLPTDPIDFAVPGCMDPLATNYNPLATFDDGSCTYAVYGCTNPLATNYDPLATADDGSCILAGCMDPLADNYDPTATVSSNACRWFGCKDVNAANYVGLLPTAGLGLQEVFGQTYSWQSTITGDGGDVFPIPCRYDKIKGCTDIIAINYNPLAVVDDGSCLYSGCTDPTADNYDATLAADCLDNIINTQFYSQYPGWNSCCEYTIKGCTDPLAINYDPNATVDDGSCIYGGCTNPDADNYDPNVTIDDGSCEWYGCTDPLADNYSFPGSGVDGPNGVFTYLTGNAVDDGSCLYDDPRDPCYQIGDITSTINGGAGGMVFALPNTTSNPTPFYFEVSLVDLSTGGTPISHYKDILVSPVTDLDDVPNACGQPSVNSPIHNFNSPWFESIDISIPNNQFRYGYSTGSFQPTVTPPLIGQPTGVNIGDPAVAVDSNNHPLFNSPTTIIDIELIPAGVNVTSTGQVVASLLYDSYLFTFSQLMVAPPFSQPVKVLTTGGILIGGAFTTSGAEWGAYNEPLSGLPIFFDEGENNTDQIVNYPALPVWPTHDTAAELCKNYSTTLSPQGWFLPSVEEFDLMYQKLGPGTPHAAALNLTIGINTSEMMEDVYWTSSDSLDGGPFGAGFYFAQAYSTNPGPWSSTIGTPIPVGPVDVTRCSSLSVRAIRKFKCQEEIILDPNRFGWTDANVKNRWRNNPITINNQDVNFSGLLTPGAMGSGYGSITKGELLPTPEAIGCTNPSSPAFDPDHIIDDLGCVYNQLQSYDDPTQYLGSFINYEGVIGLPNFGWQPATTDCAGNIWDLSDFDDANNPDGYTFKMWAADGTYLGTWHYQNCMSSVTGGRNNNWIKAHATTNNATQVDPAAPWYDAIPNTDAPGQLTSKTFPDKLALFFSNCTHIDGPHEVVCYAYSSNDNAPSNTIDWSEAMNINGGGLYSLSISNTPPFAWTHLAEPPPLGPGYTIHHTHYYNEYYEAAWLGFTAGFAFVQLDSRMSRFKPNAQPNVFNATNNVYQQKKVVCAKQVWEDIANNQATKSIQELASLGSHRLSRNSGGHIGIGGFGNPTLPNQNTTYGSELIKGANNLMQNLNRTGSPSGASQYPKHHFHPWFADYPPPLNSGLQLFDNFAFALNLLQKEEVCEPLWMTAIYPPQPPDVHTWNICGIKDTNENVVPFNGAWPVTNTQGPVIMDYLGTNSTGDDFYNDVVSTLGVVNVNNVIAVDVSIFATQGQSSSLPLASYQVHIIYLNYAGILPWSQTFTVTGLPSQPLLSIFNDCGSALGFSLTDPNGNQSARISNIDLNNQNSFQLKANLSSQNINKKKPLKIITYINNIPLYSKVKDAIDWGRQYGLEGYHEHTYKGMVGYMAGESHEQSIKAAEGQIVPQAVLESYQLPEETIVPQQQYIDPVETPEPPMQQTPPPTPPTTPTPTPPTIPPRTTYGGSSGGGGGGY